MFSDFREVSLAVGNLYRVLLCFVEKVPNTCIPRKKKSRGGHSMGKANLKRKDIFLFLKKFFKSFF